MRARSKPVGWHCFVFNYFVSILNIKDDSLVCEIVDDVDWIIIDLEVLGGDDVNVFEVNSYAPVHLKLMAGHKDRDCIHAWVSWHCKLYLSVI